MRRSRKHNRASKSKKPNLSWSRRVRVAVPRTAKQFFAKPKSFQDTWTAVTHAISKMRGDRMSLRQASGEFDLDPRLVARLGKSALRKRKNGQYVARRSDKLLRILAVPTPDGVREVATHDSKEATQLGKYWSAVQKYLQTGDDSALKKFRRKRITDASGKKIPLVLDTAVLDQLGSAGVLSFESLYAKTA
jgi:hypothetical protein